MKFYGNDYQPLEAMSQRLQAQRDFWERVFLEALQSANVENAARMADIALKEWRERFDREAA